MTGGDEADGTADLTSKDDTRRLSDGRLGTAHHPWAGSVLRPAALGKSTSSPILRDSLARLAFAGGTGLIHVMFLPAVSVPLGQLLAKSAG